MHFFQYKPFTLTSTEKGGTRAFSALPTITSSSGSHSLYEQTGQSLRRGSVALLSSAAQEASEAVAAWVLWKVRCTHPVSDLPSLKREKKEKEESQVFHTTKQIQEKKLSIPGSLSAVYVAWKAFL